MSRRPSTPGDTLQPFLLAMGRGTMECILQAQQILGHQGLLEHQISVILPGLPFFGRWNQHALFRFLFEVLLHLGHEFVVIHAGIHQFGERVRRHLRSLQEALVRASRIDVGAEAPRRSGTGLVGDARQPGNFPDDEAPGARLKFQTVRFTHFMTLLYLNSHNEGVRPGQLKNRGVTLCPVSASL